MLCWVILTASVRQKPQTALGHVPSVTEAVAVFVKVGQSGGWREGLVSGAWGEMLLPWPLPAGKYGVEPLDWSSVQVCQFSVDM